MNTMIRPPLPDPESNERAVRQEVRAMLLTESFGSNDRMLTDWLNATIGVDRASTLGPPDTSANTLLTTSAQLSTPGLYGLGAPFLRHADLSSALPLITALEDGAVWERMQFVEFMTRGVGDWCLRVEAEPDGRVSVRNVEPWNLWTRCAPDRYDRVVECRERRMRINPVTGECQWYWDVYCIAPGAERYAVIDEQNNYASNLFLLLPTGEIAPPEGMTGEAYPFRFVGGSAFVPIVWYAVQDTGAIWHEAGRRGATRGALNSMVYHTYTGKVAHSATGSTVIVVGCKPPAGDITGIGVDGTVRSLSISPGEMMFLAPDPESGTQPLITQVGPGVNLDVLSRHALVYEAQQAYREGLGADDVTRDSANPTSAAALSIKNSGKRAAATRITPHFRRRDLDMIRIASALLRLAGGEVTPETGWSVEYRQIPIGPDEAAQQFALLQAQRDAGMLSSIDLYLAIHPGVSRAAATSELQRIRREELALTQAQADHAEEMADDDAALGALIGDAERLIADGDLTSARASLLAARTLIGLDDDTEDDDAG